MSWERIIAWGRRRRLPVIITDGQGEDPMVLLPLEEFDRLSNRSVSRSSVSHVVSKKLDKTVPTEVAETSVSPEMLEKIFSSEEALISTSGQASKDVDMATASEGEMALEERFYFEPTEDESPD